jgi:hypothetical protein
MRRLWVRKKLYTRFWWGNFMDRNHLEDLDVEGMVILTWMFKKWEGVMDWIDLA